MSLGNTMDRARPRRGRTLVVGAVASAALAALAIPATASRDQQVTTLRHSGSFFITENLAAGEPLDTPTSAEIVDLTADSRTLVYTDGFTSRLGFVDVSDPANPAPLGAIDLGGSPTSVAVNRNWALVVTKTNDSFTAPTGELVVIDIPTKTIVRRIPLAGQPDSITLSPRGARYAAITIENERDEDVNDGLIPQLPAGALQILDITGKPDRWALRTVALTGLADVAPEDPEPEFVDINENDQAVVTLQENNHLVIVDLKKGTVIGDFSAGSIDIDGIDTVEESLGPQGNGVIDPSGSLSDRRREPDAVQWIDNDTFATANEGDYVDADGVEGGSRSFTLFNINGTVEYEAGNTFEHELLRAGHYPEARSENKGTEPEGLEVGHYRDKTLLFVASERGNAVVVYDVTSGTPTWVQNLPTGIGPEGLKFTGTGLLAVTSEVDGADEGFAARPFITLYRPGAPAHPQLYSVNDENGIPIPWVAMSGLSGDPVFPARMWAVSDSFLAQAYIYSINVVGPSVVGATGLLVDRIPVGGVDVDDSLGDFDLEGIAARPEGGFWLGSEGRTNAGSSRPNLIVRADEEGNVLQSVPLPADVAALASSSGIEGVAVTGTEAGGDEVVWVAIQRPWTGDPADSARIGRYEVATGQWTFAYYPLDPVESPAGGTVGLSEITAMPDGTFAIIERDNQLGQEARIKRLYTFDASSVTFQPQGATFPVLTKTLLRDVIGDLDAASVSVPDKLEGLGITASGRAFIVTDNDGVDENYGETIFLDLGNLSSGPN